MSSRAGLPTTVTPGATLRVTTAPMPTVAPRPITIGRPGVVCLMTAPAPMYAWSSMTTAPLQMTPGAKVTKSPMTASCATYEWTFAWKKRPMRTSAVMAVNWQQTAPSPRRLVSPMEAESATTGNGRAPATSNRSASISRMREFAIAIVKCFEVAG